MTICVLQTTYLGVGDHPLSTWISKLLKARKTIALHHKDRREPDKVDDWLGNINARRDRVKLLGAMTDQVVVPMKQRPRGVRVNNTM